MPLLIRPEFYFQKLGSLLKLNRQDPIELTNVLDAYNFNLIDDTFKNVGGNRGINIILETSKGKKLLKIYRATLGKSTIIQEHSILNYLEKIRFPVPRLLTAKNGETLLEFDGTFYAIFDFIEGGFKYKDFYFFPKQAKDLIYKAGTTLGELHKKMSDFIPEGYNPDGFKSRLEDRWRNLKWFKNKLQYLKNKSLDFENNDERNQFGLLKHKTENLLEALTRLDSLLLKSNLLRLVIHGDYGPYNLLFRRDGPIVVLDFEMARLDWRLDDIIHAWHRFCYNRFGYSLKKMKIFFIAYQTHMPLQFKEIKLIPDVWKHMSIRALIRNLHRYCYTGRKLSLKAAIKSLDRVEWIEANKDDLLRIICL